MNCEEYVIERLKKLEAEIDDLNCQLKSERKEKEDVRETLLELKNELCGSISEIGDATLYEGRYVQSVTLFKREFTQDKCPLLYGILKVRYEDVMEMTDHMDDLEVK